MTRTDGDLGRYRLGRLLGKGGMGEVYLARDLSLERDVAIKLLPAERAENRDARRRLLHEAQAAAKLDHPCICPVFDVGELPDGRAFLAMPFLEGETLAARLERGPVAAREALTLAQHIADALAAAHARGIVHRDLKPQNVMLTPSGLPKLLDFGVAKLKPEGVAAAEASTVSAQTGVGAVVGTPAYMAPEQVAGGDIDARCDLFALGAVLFECLTGQRAFPGRTVLEVAAAVAHVTPPPVSTLRRDVPEGIDELVARLLEKAPADRFQTATEVVGATRLLSGSSGKTPVPAPVPVPPAPAWRRRVAIAGAVVILLAAGYVATRWQQRLPQPPPEAVRWYQRGTDFIREGAYYSATEALEQAIRIFPEFPLAYARQAEALAELDDQTRAGERLLRMQAVLGDEGRLSADDQLRLRAVRSTVLREFASAVDAYRQIVRRTPGDAGAWVDLGRALESAESRTEARTAYERASAIDPGLAVAHLRMASAQSFDGSHDRALAEFAEAERLYAAASNVEGRTEVLLRRGIFLDAGNELTAARKDLEQARDLSAGTRSLPQIVRATLALGSVTASEGRTADAERLILGAIDQARKAELWSLVAEGLIDAGGILVNVSERWDEADRRVEEAATLAREKGRKRTAARAVLQRAALALQRLEPAAARNLVSETLPFLQSNGYKRLTVTALAIRARAERGLGELTSARATALEALASARQLGDDGQVAVALTSLAGIASAAGDFPAALAARDEADVLNKRLGAIENAPFDLGNRAELLALLGRTADAERLLQELEDGMKRGLDGYRGRAPRVAQIRALIAIVRDDLASAVQWARIASDTATGAVLAATSRAILAFAQARRRMPGAPSIPPPANLSPDEVADLVAWEARAALERGDRGRAADLVQQGLAFATRAANDELTWRLAAVGSLAARGMDAEVAQSLRRAAVDAIGRLSRQWGPAFTAYEARKDLEPLRHAIARETP